MAPPARAAAQPPGSADSGDDAAGICHLWRAAGGHGGNRHRHRAHEMARWLAPLLALLLIWGLMVWRCMRQSADGRLLAVTGPPAFIWLLCEPQNSDRGPWLFRLRFRAWQCLWALTTGGMLALCGWAALILLTSWLAAMQPVTVTIAVQPASGLRQLQAAVPGGPLKLWEESASALPCAAGQAFLLPMQRGPAGLWWQFRRQELRQRMQALPCRETAPARAPAAAYPIATLAAARDWR